MYQENLDNDIYQLDNDIYQDDNDIYQDDMYYPQLTTTIGAPIYLPNSHPSCRNQPLLT